MRAGAYTVTTLGRATKHTVAAHHAAQTARCGHGHSRCTHAIRRPIAMSFPPRALWPQAGSRHHKCVAFTKDRGAPYCGQLPSKWRLLGLFTKGFAACVRGHARPHGASNQVSRTHATGYEFTKIYISCTESSCFRWSTSKGRQTNGRCRAPQFTNSKRAE